MSVPPSLIRVKRKRTEEAPVSFLRVQEDKNKSKKLRSEFFVYQRQDNEAAFASVPQGIEKPVIHTSQPKGDASRNPKKHETTSPTGQDEIPTESHVTPGPSTAEPRRFHMSRPDATSDYPYPGRTSRGITKKRGAPTLFVERRIKQISKKTVEKLHSAAQASASRHEGEAAQTSYSQAQNDSSAQDVDMVSTPPKKFKKPGVARLAGKGDVPKPKTEVPTVVGDRWNVDMDKLTADMNAYTMEQIGLNLKKAEEEKQREAAVAASRTPTSPQMRFKPKAPAKRYHERHPPKDEATGGAPEDADEEMADADGGDTDDEYIIETYIRVPASKIGDHVPPQSVGLLVFDREPDMEYFYGDGDDSDNEWAEDDEDENAENYYTADYPEDEVASDDEFDQNPYSYRTGNASDMEEYDALDDSDDDDIDGEFGITASGFRSFRSKYGTTVNHL